MFTQVENLGNSASCHRVPVIDGHTKGLNVLALCVGEMSKSFTRELENEKIKFNIIDGEK